MPHFTSSRGCTPARPYALLLFLCLGLTGLLVTPSQAQEQSQTQEQTRFQNEPPRESERALRVAVRESPPFAFQDSAGNWDGLSVALWQDVADRLNTEFEWVETPLSATFDALARNEVDIAITALSITAERETRVDFSHPYLVSGLALAFRSESDGAWLDTLRAFVSWEFVSAVGSLFIVLLIAGVLIWLFERKANADEFGQGNVPRGLGDGLWWSAVTMTTVGYGDKAPKTPGGRIVGLIWMFTSLIIIASFTASIAASLTANRLDEGGLRDKPVSELRVATVDGSSALSFARAQGGRVNTYPSVGDALDALSDEDVDAVIYDAPILKHWVRETHDDLEVDDRVLVRDDYGFAFSEDSEIRKPVNDVLLRLIQEPVWQDIKQRFLGEELAG